MEEVINKRNYEEHLYEILGNADQTLQLVLLPEQSFYARKHSILYMSPKIQLQSTTNFTSWFKSVYIYYIYIYIYRDLAMGTKKSLDTILENKSSSIEYVGLKLNDGRIIIINPLITNDLVVKEQYILGHTPNIQIECVKYVIFKYI